MSLELKYLVINYGNKKSFTRPSVSYILWTVNFSVSEDCYKVDVRIQHYWSKIRREVCRKDIDYLIRVFHVRSGQGALD